MGNYLSANPVATAVIGIICGVVILYVLGYIIYKIVNRKKFDFDKFTNDNDTNEELSTRTNCYAKIQNTI